MNQRGAKRRSSEDGGGTLAGAVVYDQHESGVLVILNRTPHTNLSHSCVWASSRMIQ